MVNLEAAAPETSLPYREALRAIGAYLDSVRARDLVLAEVAGGYLWSYRITSDERLARSSTISYEDLPKLREQVRAAKRALLDGPTYARIAVAEGTAKLPVYPNGYEEKLRSLGAKLDSLYAQQVRLVEQGEDLLVQFVVTPPAYMRRALKPVPELLQFREDTYTLADTIELVNRSRSRRGSNHYY